jgi:hypothetical protein
MWKCTETQVSSVNGHHAQFSYAALSSWFCNSSPARWRTAAHASISLNRDSPCSLWQANSASVILKRDFDKTLKYRISGMASPGTCMSNYRKTLPRKPSANWCYRCRISRWVRLLTALSVNKKGSFTFTFEIAQSSHSGSHWQLSLCHQDFRYPWHAHCSLTVGCDLIDEHAVLPTCHVIIYPPVEHFTSSYSSAAWTTDEVTGCNL